MPFDAIMGSFAVQRLIPNKHTTMSHMGGTMSDITLETKNQELVLVFA